MSDEKEVKYTPCINCEYSWHYFVNGLKPCPDAFTEVAKECALNKTEQTKERE